MYSSERANTKYTDFESTRIIAGIQDNVLLTNIEKKTSPNGTAMLAFTFTQGNKSIEVTEWEPKATSFMSIEDAVDRNFKKIQQILLAFYSDKESLSVEAANFYEFSNWVISMWDNADKSTLLRVKFNYDYKNYVSFPKHGYYDLFIEPMSRVEAGEGKVVKHKNDIFEKKIVADVEPRATTIVPGISELAEDDDLPF